MLPNWRISQAGMKSYQSVLRQYAKNTPLSKCRAVSRIGFLTTYSPGHLNPSTVLGRALKQRNHEPVFFNILDSFNSRVVARSSLPLA
jgi:hypothetical protein